MINNKEFENLAGILKLSLFTSVLYYCGYLSNEYHYKVIGINGELEAIDYLKWGGDFFIYTFVDFISNYKALLHFRSLDILIYLGIAFLITAYFTKGKPKAEKVLDKLVAVYAVAFFIVCIYLLRIFIQGDYSKGLINYSYFEDYRAIPEKYWVITACSILLQVYIWTGKNEIYKKRLFILSLFSLMLLPALYGVYGKGYDCAYVRAEKKLVVGQNENYFYTVTIEKDTLAIPEYKLEPKDSFNFRYSETYNFFDYISKTIK